jgi:hypothetical protein
MARSEIIIFTEGFKGEDKEKHEDALIIALARFGYSPYFTYDNDGVGFNVDTDESVKQIEEKKHD